MAQQKSEQQAQIRHYSHLFLKWKWLVIVPTLIGGIVGGGIAYYMPNQYRSSCTLRVKKPSVAVKILGAAPFLETGGVLQAVREVMLGWEPVMKVAKTVGMDKDIAEDDVAAHEKLFLKLIKNVNIRQRGGRRSRGGGLIEVAYTGEYPERNFRIVSMLVAEFMETALKASRTETQKSLDYIEANLKQVEQEKQQAEEKLRQFEMAHLDELPDSTNSAYAHLKECEAELRDAELGIAEQQEKMKFLKSAWAEAQIDARQTELAKLLFRYTDEHPSVKRLKAEIAMVRKQVAAGIDVLGKSTGDSDNPVLLTLRKEKTMAEMGLKSLLKRKGDLQARIAKLQESVELLPKVRQELDGLRTLCSNKQTLYEQRLLDRAKAQMAIDIALEGSTVPFEVLEPARPSYDPVRSRKAKLALMSLVLGGGFGIGLVILIDFFDQKLGTLDSAQVILQAPALGVLPTIITKKDVHRHRLRMAATAALVLILIGGSTTVFLTVEPVNQRVTMAWLRVQNAVVDRAKALMGE